jgi:hypothetical protein
VDPVLNIARIVACAQIHIGMEPRGFIRSPQVYSLGPGGAGNAGNDTGKSEDLSGQGSTIQDYNNLDDAAGQVGVVFPDDIQADIDIGRENSE